MSHQVSAEDLLVLARQCKLSEEDERRFEIAMQSSRELECLYDAGLHFDQEAGVLSGDEKRLGQLVSRALERLDQSHDRSPASRAGAAALPEPALARPYRTRSAFRYFAGSMGLGTLLCVTLASAWTYVEKRATQQQAQQAQKASPARASTAAGRRLASPAPTPSRAPASVSSEPLGALPHRSPVPAAPRQVTAEQLSSSELFARANQARRSGDIEQAISLYERLAQAYPGSIEAEDAKILRGNLLLMQRSPRAALRQFEEYHSGALSLEALWGRAQALRKLESPDERAVLIELVRDHPDSPYTDAAKKRLNELAR
jgi:TolA-binding protein